MPRGDARKAEGASVKGRGGFGGLGEGEVHGEMGERVERGMHRHVSGTALQEAVALADDFDRRWGLGFRGVGEEVEVVDGDAK
jgi:hypothetical protein